MTKQSFGFVIWQTIKPTARDTYSVEPGCRLAMRLSPTQAVIPVYPQHSEICLQGGESRIDLGRTIAIGSLVFAPSGIGKHEVAYRKLTVTRFDDVSQRTHPPVLA